MSNNQYTNNHIITIDCNEGKLQEAARIYAKGASPRVTKILKKKRSHLVKTMGTACAPLGVILAPNP